MTAEPGPPRCADDVRWPGCELPVTAEGDGVRLASSVWLPATQPPRGLMLMYPGSGPSDRGNDVLFAPIRETLLGTGIAVCSFDKRGVGGSSGHWLDAGIERQAEDLAQCLRAARDIVPAGPVGLFGHSQGGWVVLEASQLIDPSFVVTNSGPSVTPFQQEEYSTRNRLRNADWSAADISSGVRLFRDLMTMALDGVPFEVAQERIAESGRRDELRGLADAGVFIPDSERMWFLASLLLDYDPTPALANLTVPLLALFGGLDSIVPVEECVGRLRRIVPAHLLHVEVVDQSDHRLQLGGSDEFAPGYLAALTAFVDAQLQRADGGADAGRSSEPSKP